MKEKDNAIGYMENQEQVNLDQLMSYFLKHIENLKTNGGIIMQMKKK